VYFKAIIRNLAEISTTSESFELDVWLGAWTGDTAFWSNELNGAPFRVQEIFQKQFSSKSDCFDVKQKLPPWHLTLQNAMDVTWVYKEQKLPTLRHATRNGEEHAFERQHVECKVLVDLDLTDFPLDLQFLELVVSLDVDNSVAYFAKASEKNDKALDGYDDIYIDSTRKQSGRIAGEWHMATSRPPQRDDADLGDARKWRFDVVAHAEPDKTTYSYSRIRISIPIQRDPSYYVTTMMIPLWIVTTSSFFALVVEKSYLSALVSLQEKKNDDELGIGEVLQYLSTLLLTVIAFKWSVSEKLPKARRPSFLIRLFTFSYFFIVLTMLMAILCHIYDMPRRAGVAVNLAVYIAIHYWCWWR